MTTPAKNEGSDYDQMDLKKATAEKPVKETTTAKEEKKPETKAEERPKESGDNKEDKKEKKERKGKKEGKEKKPDEGQSVGKPVGSPSLQLTPMWNLPGGVLVVSRNGTNELAFDEGDLLRIDVFQGLTPVVYGDLNKDVEKWKTPILKHLQSDAFTQLVLSQFLTKFGGMFGIQLTNYQGPNLAPVKDLRFVISVQYVPNDPPVKYDHWDKNVVQITDEMLSGVEDNLLTTRINLIIFFQCDLRAVAAASISGAFAPMPMTRDPMVRASILYTGTDARVNRYLTLIHGAGAVIIEGRDEVTALDAAINDEILGYTFKLWNSFVAHCTIRDGDLKWLVYQAIASFCNLGAWFNSEFDPDVVFPCLGGFGSQGTSDGKTRLMCQQICHAPSSSNNTLFEGHTVNQAVVAWANHNLHVLYTNGRMVSRKIAGDYNPEWQDAKYIYELWLNAIGKYTFPLSQCYPLPQFKDHTQLAKEFGFSYGDTAVQWYYEANDAVGLEKMRSLITTLSGLLEPDEVVVVIPNAILRFPKTCFADFGRIMTGGILNRRSIVNFLSAPDIYTKCLTGKCSVTIRYTTQRWARATIDVLLRTSAVKPVDTIALSQGIKNAHTHHLVCVLRIQ